MRLEKAELREGGPASAVRHSVITVLLMHRQKTAIPIKSINGGNGADQRKTRPVASECPTGPEIALDGPYPYHLIYLQFTDNYPFLMLITFFWRFQKPYSYYPSLKTTFQLCTHIHMMPFVGFLISAWERARSVITNLGSHSDRSDRPYPDWDWNLARDGVVSAGCRGDAGDRHKFPATC